VTEPFYRFKVGDFDCVAVLDFEEVRNAAEYFPDVPEVELTRELVRHGYDPAKMLVCISLAVHNGQQ